MREKKREKKEKEKALVFQKLWSEEMAEAPNKGGAFGTLRAQWAQVLDHEAKEEADHHLRVFR
jgi:hypothetical protein